MACEYCDWVEKPVPFFYHGPDFPVGYVDGDYLAVDICGKQRLFFEAKRTHLTSPINFCPMCGEDLREGCE